MPATLTNLFADLALDASEEVVTVLHTAPGLRIERIVSTGQASPPGFHYDQPHAEWVAVLAGSAELRFADESAPRRLTAGDTLLIEPHRRHRVERTDAPTIWLAIHVGPEIGADESP
ncbi:cupin domain-containing protein [Methylobacterium pseudosasicola]|uniref:Cupin 2 domain-containing protein n=1 Tax=Methylobacterium pseudosasicola TaxID=582667 RepID=A0A1I4JKT9_9HYPH|nr:cupin domain-containing protein [Methylobacterium pseudosasicola]SFL67170.1 cupin 2 domain-containing protein [Methylobacterium pseudosasicola]